MGIGERLAEERKRLGLGQGDFARKSGVSLSTQKRYETNDREPGTGYLECIRKLGVDLPYVLTGTRRGNTSGSVSTEDLAEFGLAAMRFFGIQSEEVLTIAREAEKATKAEFYSRAESSDADEEISRHIEAFEEYFFVHASTLIRQRLGELSAQGTALDPTLLASSIELIDHAIERAGMALLPAKRAQLVAMAYKLAKRTGSMDADIAEDVVSIAER